MVLLAHVRSAFRLSNGTYGSPRMRHDVQADGITIGRNIDGFYNPVRHHSAFDFISPVQFERRAVA